MKINFLVVALGVLCLSGANVFAADGVAYSNYVEQLNLTPEQLVQAQKISQNEQALRKELLESVAQFRAQTKTKAESIKENSLKEFMEILTDEQKAKFATLQNPNLTSVAENAAVEVEKAVVEAENEEVAESGKEALETVETESLAEKTAEVVEEKVQEAKAVAEEVADKAVEATETAKEKMTEAVDSINEVKAEDSKELDIIEDDPMLN